MQPIYLDNAASTCLDPAVIETMYQVMVNHYGNPSSVHEYGRESKTIIEKVRKQIAHQFNVLPSEIFFTSGGTESLNFAITSTIHSKAIKHVITSPIEHLAVLNTLRQLEKLKQIEIHYIHILANGHICLNSLTEALSKFPNSLVVLMHANNELGNFSPISKISNLCKTYQSIFLCDTIQTIGKYVINLSDSGIDIAIGSAHKIHGPKGIGFIYLNKKNKINPFILGGSQEMNMRAGTENVVGIAGLGKAIEIAYQNIEEQQNKILILKKYLIEKIQNELPNITFNGDFEQKSIYSILNISVPLTRKTEMIFINFDIEKIAISSGSACSSGVNTTSHVIKFLHPNEQRIAVRVSLSKYNSIAELEGFFNVLKQIIN